MLLLGLMVVAPLSGVFHVFAQEGEATAPPMEVSGTEIPSVPPPTETVIIDVMPSETTLPTIQDEVPPQVTEAPTEAPLPPTEPILTETPVVETETPVVDVTETPEIVETVVPTPDEPVPTTEHVETATAESTATPSPTPSSTQSSTPSPLPTPTPSPTPTPAIPFDPLLTCQPAPGFAAAVAGDPNWTYLDCAMTWETEDVSSVTVQRPAAPSGWEITLVNDRTVEDPAAAALASEPLGLQDDTSADKGFLTSRFSIASRVACEAPATAHVAFDVEAASNGAETVEQVNRELGMTASPATLPDISVTSAVFEAVDPAQGANSSTGVITVDYSGASPHCDWSIVTTVSDFVSVENTIPASEMSLVEVSFLTDLIVVHDGGEVELFPVPGVDTPTSGTITMVVSTPMPEVLTDGKYLATITARANAP